MNRERLAWTVSVILLAMLAFQLPGSFAQRDDDYAFVRTLVDIHRHVAGNYVDPVDESKLRASAIEGMLTELDPFTTYVPPEQQEDFDRMLEGSFKGVGIQLNQLDNGQVEVVTPIEGSPAFKAGVLAGDIIQKVNGEAIDGIRLPDVIKKVGGPLGTQVKLTVKHVTGEVVELTMTREEIVIPSIKGFERKTDGNWDYFVSKDPKIAYVRVAQFTSDVGSKLREILMPLLNEGMKGLIIDLRFNPGGRLEEAVDMCDLFLNKGVIVTTRGRNRAEYSRSATEAGTLPYFPMVVLVNEGSASASEIVAGALQDHRRALVVGERTYGKGSVQELIPLDSRDGELKLTVAYYYLPSGRLVHRKKDATDWGVKPQIQVSLEPAAERAAFLQMNERDRYLRPTTEPTTQVASAPATSPTTQPLFDAQLQRGVDTLVAAILFQGGVPSFDAQPPTTSRAPGDERMNDRLIRPEPQPQPQK